MLTVKDVQAAYPDLETWNDDEDARRDKIARLKLKGKGAPKKKRTKEGRVSWDLHFPRTWEDAGSSNG